MIADKRVLFCLFCSAAAVCCVDLDVCMHCSCCLGVTGHMHTVKALLICG